MKRSPPSRRQIASRRQSISLGAFFVHANGEDRLLLFPQAIGRALGMKVGQKLRLDPQDGELRIQLPTEVSRRALFRASAGWPSIRRSLRGSTAPRD